MDDEGQEPVRYRVAERGRVHVPPSPGGEHADAEDHGAVPFPVRRLVEMKGVRGRRPAPIHEHRRAVGEPERRHQVHAGHPFIASGVPEPLVCVIVDAPRVQPAVAGGVRRERRVDLEGETRASGEQEGVTRAPLVQAVELPHPKPNARRRDDDRDHQTDPIAPVQSHREPRTSASFSTRDSRRTAASRRSAADRSGWRS